MGAPCRPKQTLASGAKAHNGDTEKVMLARAHTFTIEGLEARFVTVEVDIRVGLPSFTIVGQVHRPLPTPHPTPDISKMHCTDWRGLDIGSGRVQVCE